MAGFLFKDDELKKIEDAVATAERKTSGEIAVAFTRQSDSYASHELLFSIGCGFLYFMIMLFFTHGVEAFVRQLSWEYSVTHLVMAYGFSTFVLIFLIYLLANIPLVDRLIVPRSIMRRKVRERALRHFTEAGVYKTKDQTGILIFISHLERRIELLADSGIAAKIQQQTWDKIVQHIIDGIRQGTLVDHLIESIGRCGDILAEHFPIQPDDVNELKNGIEILEK